MMDFNESSRIRVLLTNEELQFPAIDELCNKYMEWLAVSKEAGSGRKTRSAIRKLDSLYDEIMAYKLPVIKLNDPLCPTIVKNEHTHKSHSVNSSMESSMSESSTSSRPITRSLRSRSRTPTVQSQQPPTSQKPQLVRQPNAPATPSNQRIRAQMRQPVSGSSNGTASASKLRQVLRADSNQKKKLEEKERQERLMMDRKIKEERAEAQKKQLLEERAITAKMKREQRLLHAAEVRKAREEAKKLQKLRELEAKKASAAVTPEIKTTHDHVQMTAKETTKEEKQKYNGDTLKQQQQQNGKSQSAQVEVQALVLNETFKKPSAAEDNDNIDISIQDETTEEAQDKVKKVAQWTRAPHLREALIEQFSKSDSERKKDVLAIFPAVELPVELIQIFGPTKAVTNRYLYRTSSAVWTPPNRAIKRGSSMIDSTPEGRHH